MRSVKGMLGIIFGLCLVTTLNAAVIVEKDGNVGIGTNDPKYPLEVVGGIKAGDAYTNILSFTHNGPADTVKIKTNIPFENDKTIPTLMIEGVHYRTGKPIGIMLSFYVYNNHFYNPKATSYGDWVPELTLAKEDDKIVIFMKDKSTDMYFSRFGIRAYTGKLGEQAEWFSNWTTAVDEALTGEIKKVVAFSSSTGTLVVDGSPGVKLTHDNSQIRFYGDGKEKWAIGSTGAEGSDFLIYDVFRKTQVMGINETTGATYLSQLGIGTAVPEAPLEIHFQSEVNEYEGLNLFNKQASQAQGYGTGINYYFTDASGTEKRLSGEIKLKKSDNWSSPTATNKNTSWEFSNMYKGVLTDSLVIEANGSVSVKGGVVAKSLNLKDVDGNSVYGMDVNSANDFTIGWNHPNLRFGTSEKERLRIDHNGNVGIGVTNPDYKLVVNGGIKAREIFVPSPEEWPDFVFESNYNLPSIAQVKNFVQSFKHLPGIPSAKEIKQTGVNVGDIQVKMLQKIEELTLYVIHLEGEINQLKKDRVEK